MSDPCKKKEEAGENSRFRTKLLIAEPMFIAVSIRVKGILLLLRELIEL